MRSTLGTSLLISPLLAAAGCASSPDSFMHWRRSAVDVKVATVPEVDEVIRSARRQLRDLDLQPIWTAVIEEQSGLPPSSLEISVVKRESLFGVNWRPQLDGDGLADHKLRGQLTVSVDRNWFSPEGDIKAEAILAGIRQPDHGGTRELVVRIVRAVVDRVERIVLEAAEENGKRATVVAFEETPTRVERALE